MMDERILKVSEDDAGQRLDRWLKRVAPDMPYGLVQKLLRKGAIRVSGQKAKPDSRLGVGQEVRIPPIEDRDANDQEDKEKLSAADADFIKSLVIYEDQDIIALNKPAGIPVQGGSGIKRHIDGMLKALADKNGVYPRLVHRLDKDTSGILLLARSAAIARNLGAFFKKRDIKKIYWAIVHPAPKIKEGTIKAPLAKSGNYEKMHVDEEEGKKAVTDYRVLEYAGDLAAFVAFWPRTGRTHQIRAHAALVLSTPILGDEKYGTGAAIEGLDGLARALHLHAARMILPHPGGKGILDISADLPESLQKSWKALGFPVEIKEDLFKES